MKKDRQSRMVWMAIAMVATLSLGLAGCDESKKDAAAAPAAVEQKKAAEQPAAENPATAKPKDHPAH